MVGAVCGRSKARCKPNHTPINPNQAHVPSAGRGPTTGLGGTRALEILLTARGAAAGTQRTPHGRAASVGFLVSWLSQRC